MLENVGIEAVHVEARDIEYVTPYGWRGKTCCDVWPCDVWRVTLTYQGRTYTTEYRTGIGHRRQSAERGFYREAATVKKKITARDVLDCLFSDADSGGEMFADFCDNMAMSTDSRKALDTYLACQDTRRKLQTLLRADYSTIAEEVRS